MYKKDFKTANVEFNIDDVLKIAWEAGKAIMDIYKRDFEVEFKEDESPLTIADKTAHEIIQKRLTQLSIKSIDSIDSIDSIKSINSIPILSEEGKDIPFEKRKNWKTFWMVDPLDGTKEFIKKNGEFTINIALIHNNEPVFGVVYAPAIDEIYFTDNENSYKANLSVDKFELKNIQKLPIVKEKVDFVIVASKSHLNEETEKFINSIKSIYSIDAIKTISKGSSLKLCMVAEGVADIYPRLAPTMEWDTAAADAVVRKSGKLSYNYENDLPLRYNKENLLNPFFIVK